MNINYRFLDYYDYLKQIDSFLVDDRLKQMGIKPVNLGRSYFGYNIDCITVGHGNKHVFVVGGTHGCEIISVDYVCHLMNNLQNLSNFDPNVFKLFFIPMQNPEGFVITTDSLNEYNVKKDFLKASKEYYLRYKMDNILSSFIKQYNNIVSSNENDINSYFKDLKYYIGNSSFKNLSNNDLMGNGILYFISKINGIEDDISNNFVLKNLIINICKNVYDNYDNSYLKSFMLFLVEHFDKSECLDLIDTNITKFHQDMFKNLSFKFNNYNLDEYIKMYYDVYNYPVGSLITYDANGLGINLNANQPNNPGIAAYRDNIVYMAGGARNNLRKYTPGPVGTAYCDKFNFDYACENKYLYNIINKSYKENKLSGVFLFHGTGGLIYYQPNANEMNSNDYNSFYNYNYDISSIYNSITSYKLVNSTEFIGYGDLLRKTFPGVLMIELSLMGGNPLAPYGDINNIYRTYNENLKAFDDVLAYMSKCNVINKKVLHK